MNMSHPSDYRVCLYPAVTVLVVAVCLSLRRDNYYVVRLSQVWYDVGNFHTKKKTSLGYIITGRVFYIFYRNVLLSQCLSTGTTPSFIEICVYLKAYKI